MSEGPGTRVLAAFASFPCAPVPPARVTSVSPAHGSERRTAPYRAGHACEWWRGPLARPGPACRASGGSPGNPLPEAFAARLESAGRDRLGILGRAMNRLLLSGHFSQATCALRQAKACLSLIHVLCRMFKCVALILSG
jgi:hypothetical protein